MDWYTYFNQIDRSCTLEETEQVFLSEKRISRKRLGEILIGWGAIDNVQLRKALDIQKSLSGQKDIKTNFLSGEILVGLGLVHDIDIVKALTMQYHLPFIQVSRYNINKEAVNMVSKDLAKKHTLIPLEKIEMCLTVAMANPFDRPAIEGLEQMTGCSIQIILSDPTEIKQAIRTFYPL